MFYDPHIQRNIYTFVHRERFHPGKNVIEKKQDWNILSKQEYFPKQIRYNLGSLLLFLKNATQEIQAHWLLLNFVQQAEQPSSIFKFIHITVW